MNDYFIQDGHTRYSAHLLFSHDAYRFVSETSFANQIYTRPTASPEVLRLERMIDRYEVTNFLDRHHLPITQHHMFEAAVLMGREWADPKIKLRERELLYGPDHMLAPDPLIDAAIIKEREAKEAEQQAAQVALETNPLWGSF